MRFVLRAQPISAADHGAGLELAREIDADLIRDKIVNHQAIPTPEATFELLWSQLKVDLDLRDGR
jgi:hypothetical protein